MQILDPTDERKPMRRTLAPRGAFDLGDTPVLQVKASGPTYLRATTADRYAGQAITSTETTSGQFDANTDLLPPDAIPRRCVKPSPRSARPRSRSRPTFPSSLTSTA